jgi:hypothetical protein
MRREPHQVETQKHPTTSLGSPKKSQDEREGLTAFCLNFLAPWNCPQTEIC